MILESIRVRNFRSILDETLYFESLTALVGSNGSGKSSFLRGLQLFYESSPRIEIDDFYNRDTTAEIIITVTFRDLSPEAQAQFSSYMQGDKLTVERVFVWDNGKVTWKYHGSTLQNPAFQEIRDALAIKDRGKSAREAYERVRTQADFGSLPPWSTLGAVPDNLKQWEAEHPDCCTRQRDDGQFFGFKEVAQGYLGRFTHFIFIPAVRDASDDSAEGRGSVLTELMDLVVRNALSTNNDLASFKREVQERYSEIIDPASRAELTSLADRMTKTLETFVPDSDVRVDLQWLPSPEINIPLPQAEVKIIEDGYSSVVSRTGHGLQRAFILTILQHLVLAQSVMMTVDESSEKQNQAKQEIRLPNLVLSIEEPELYQHPNRQRHLAKILSQLASGKIPGVAERTQVVYSTHSPLFVGIDRVDQIRLFRKTSYAPDKPKVTRVISTNLDKVAETIWEADGKPSQQYTGETLLPRLQTIMTPWMSEGFFAEVIVLVEGEDDRAAILGVAAAMGYDLESKGISVIPCGGKRSLDRPTAIFRHLGIPVYVIWDSDKGENNSNPEENHRLLRLMGKTVEDWPCQVCDQFACFESKLEYTLQDEIGKDEFEQCLKACQEDFCIPKKKYAIKNPMVIAKVIQMAQRHGRSPTLENIVNRILAMK
ncbi:Predicted ATP-dependent endonuclease of the OLD family, contains P-loop ATPase and TOPRIM domains [Desulfacinum infernum DSM 9756]|uniref:Predicted ATP-dependent endonuclease of the OLD family, contains P-loop ATPase and TOPRIM domains n=1 Tax=Desulfacinum infernum DSM 9756 TaxID=1121391 RepID=A0A1M4S7M9_9BACT|nr:ATP-dependent endonuclease [Desulfacinum infernum]SHE28190.1 Predicted ATP-dependent endonuclease of the OLD family, contains P-loop ATPase and TOPRIM domains [Desulfacinum infernum DSM 9756]